MSSQTLHKVEREWLKLQVSSMGNHDLLKQFGLARNPFIDRTAEKTFLDGSSIYVHSDLQGFEPSETTYVFFGRRGSGKTTIRLQVSLTSWIDKVHMSTLFRQNSMPIYAIILKLL